MPKEKSKSKFVTARLRRKTNEKIRKAQARSKYILTFNDIISSALDLYLKRQREDEEFV